MITRGLGANQSGGVTVEIERSANIDDVTLTANAESELALTLNYNQTAATLEVSTQTGLISITEQQLTAEG